MLDVNQVLNGVTLIASLIVIGGAAIAIYVYWSWIRFASGKWILRSVAFYPEASTIKIEKAIWIEAPAGETLPPETLSIRASEEDPWTPVGGLTRFKFTGTLNPPAVLVHLVIINPNLNPAVAKEIVFTIKRRTEERTHQFQATYVAEPPGLQFKDYWGSLLVKPASCSSHWLVLVPPFEANMDFKLTAGEYECAIEFAFEDLFKLFALVKRLTRRDKRRVTVKADIDKDAEEKWERKEVVVLPPSLLK